MDTTPNPGSREAVARGCTCPAIDNHYGKGFPYMGETCFWKTAKCPLHGIGEGAP